MGNNTSCNKHVVKPIYGVRALENELKVKTEDLLKLLPAQAGGKVSVVSKFYGQATKSMRVDALARVGDEGRGQLRKASGRSKLSVIRGCPNGGTQPMRTSVTLA
jgi:hypothetical protein